MSDETKEAKAIRLIREHDYAALKTADSRKPNTTKRLEQSAAALFVAITGRKPTPEELKDMTTF